MPDTHSPNLLATPDEFRRGMRQLAASVNIVTVVQGDAREGLTATAVCSISAEPPHLLVCVNATATAHESMHKTGAFCLNVLARDQEAIAKRFAGMDGTARLERFGLGTWTQLTTGAPVLEGALANFDCIVVREIEAATHTIFIGRVLAIRTSQGQPLVYGDGKFAGLGG